MTRLPALLLWLCSSIAFASPVQLERGNGPEPATLDAHRCQEVACGNVLRDLYEGLVTEDAAGRLVPGMARDWSVSRDGRVWTFVLRDGLRWSNGEALDAAQVVASFRRAFAPATAAPFGELFDALHNARRVQAGTVWINTYKQFSIATPFGGWRDSGIGREKGRLGLLEYMRQKSLYWGLN